MLNSPPPPRAQITFVIPTSDHPRIIYEAATERLNKWQWAGCENGLAPCYSNLIPTPSLTVFLLPLKRKCRRGPVYYDSRPYRLKDNRMDRVSHSLLSTSSAEKDTRVDAISAFLQTTLFPRGIGYCTKFWPGAKMCPRGINLDVVCDWHAASLTQHPLCPMYMYISCIYMLTLHCSVTFIALHFMSKYDV